MSVIRTIEVPPGAKIMTLQDVCDFQWNIIDTWKKRTDVWTFSYGLGILSGTASLSSLWIGDTLRVAYRVMKKNAILVMLPLFALPPTLIYTYQSSYVVPNLFLLDLHECLLCPMARSTFIQVALGIVYPIVAGNLISWGTLFKDIHTRQNVPPITEYAKTAKLFYSHTKPLFPRIAILFFAHTVLSQGITYLQYQQLLKIQAYTMLMEEEERAEREKRMNSMLTQHEVLKKKKMAEIEEIQRQKAAAKERQEEFILKDIEEKERNYG